MTAAQAAVGAGDQAVASAPMAPTAAEPMPLDEEQNALLASLIQAMREVADREREASLSGLRSSVDEAIETLRARAAEGAEDLRRRSDDDIAGIHEWVRKEIERVTAEGDRKTETRRQQLTQQLTDHEQRSQREIEGLHARVDDYERELAAFFAQLGEIDDPAAFGAAAKRMPRPPAMATAAAAAAPPAPAASGSTNGTAGQPSGGATAPESTATEPAESTSGEAASGETASAETREAEASSEAAETEIPSERETQQGEAASSESGMVEEHRHRLDVLGIGRNGAEAEHTEPAEQAADVDPLRARLAQLDAEIGEEGAAAGPQATSAEPAPSAAGQEMATAIVVHGLGSFGAITSFKQALERVEGVRGISLSLGPTGEFVYRATHDAGFDLVAAIEQIERGPAQIDRQPDGSLRVTVQRTR